MLSRKLHGFVPKVTRIWVLLVSIKIYTTGMCIFSFMRRQRHNSRLVYKDWVGLGSDVEQKGYSARNILFFFIRWTGSIFDTLVVWLFDYMSTLLTCIVTSGYPSLLSVNNCCSQVSAYNALDHLILSFV